MTTIFGIAPTLLPFLAMILSGKKQLESLEGPVYSRLHNTQGSSKAFRRGKSCRKSRRIFQTKQRRSCFFGTGDRVSKAESCLRRNKRAGACGNPEDPPLGGVICDVVPCVTVVCRQFTGNLQARQLEEALAVPQMWASSPWTCTSPRHTYARCMLIGLVLLLLCTAEDRFLRSHVTSTITFSGRCMSTEYALSLFSTYPSCTTSTAEKAQVSILDVGLD